MGIEIMFGEFFKAYGSALAMLIIQGILIALFIELAIKKAFDTMIEKAKDTTKLTTAKTIVCTDASVVLSVILAAAVVKSMPLPGNIFLYPTWIAIVYVVQYVFSLYGIKWIQAKIEAAGNKEPKPKKKNVTIEEGTKIYKQDENGNFVEV